MRCLIMVLIALLTASCHAQEHIRHVASAVDLRAKTVVLVETDEDNELAAYCSGVWVSETSILTALHCVDDLRLGESVQYTASSYIDAPRRAVLYGVDPRHDLALLRATIPPPGHAVAYLRRGDIEQGMPAQVMGHSLGMVYSYSSGEVSALREIDLGPGKAMWIQTTTPVSPGNSGGGLFDSEGDLMGICHGSFTRGQLLNVFVHEMYIQRLFEEARKVGVL